MLIDYTVVCDDPNGGHYIWNSPTVGEYLDIFQLAYIYALERENEDDWSIEEGYEFIMCHNPSEAINFDASGTPMMLPEFPQYVIDGQYSVEE